MSGTEIIKKEDWINPLDGVITSSCGERINPILRKKEIHDGIDISAKKNTEALAMLSGVVTEVSTSPTFGNLLKYKTNNGYIIMYAHLQKAKVKVGDKIKQGDTIALTGNTGLSTGPHLHLSVWKDGELIDPINFLELPHTDEVVKEYASRGVDFK